MHSLSFLDTGYNERADMFSLGIVFVQCLANMSTEKYIRLLAELAIEAAQKGSNSA